MGSNKGIRPNYDKSNVRLLPNCYHYKTINSSDFNYLTTVQGGEVPQVLPERVPGEVRPVEGWDPPAGAGEGGEGLPGDVHVPGDHLLPSLLHRSGRGQALPLHQPRQPPSHLRGQVGLQAGTIVFRLIIFFNFWFKSVFLLDKSIFHIT